MKGIFNACDKKNLKLNNPDYVKHYKTGREYFGWEDALSSTCIKTNFGIFTSAKRARVKNDKGRYEYFITLANEKEEITLKQNQLCNKKMPKNAIRVSKVNTFVFKGFKHQLCLPAPKDIIDMLLEQMNKAVAEHNNKCKGKNGKVKKSLKWDTWEEVMNNCPDLFESKINFILGTASDIGNIKHIYNQLVNEYHPDKTHKNTNEEFAIIAEYYNLYK